MFQQFVGFVLRGLAIVAGDAYAQIVRKQVAAQRVHFAQHSLTNIRRVGSFAFGKGDGHRRIIRARNLSRAATSIGEQDVGVGLGWAVFELLGYIAQVDGTSAVNPDHDLAQVFEIREKSAGFDLKLAIVARKAAGLSTAVGALELCHDSARRKPVGCQALCVEHHSHLPRLPADDPGLGNVVELLQRVFQFPRDSAETVRIVVLPPKGQRHDGHVIDRTDLDDRLRDAGWDSVEVGVKLVVGLHDRVFLFAADIEAHDQHAHARMTDGVDVLDAWHLAQQFLHRKADSLRDFFRRRPRHLHKHVEHGNHNLRLFFPRSLKDAEGAQKQRGNDH